MVKRAIITLLLMTGSILALVILTNGKTTANQWGMVWNDEFKGAAVSNAWDILQQNKDNLQNTHLAYSANNIKIVGNDHLQITTQRHCASSLSEPLTDANASEQPCPSGKMTRYLSGRVKNRHKVVDGTKPFRAEIRAKFNWNGKRGTRPSLWMVSGNTLQNCDDTPGANDPYGELDIIEWYSYTPNYAWSTTHMSCYHHGVDATWKTGWRTRSFSHSGEHYAGAQPGSFAYEWHTWAVEYDGTTVKYFVDDQPIKVYRYHVSPTNNGTITPKKDAEPLTKIASQENINAAFHRGWQFILNDYVEISKNLSPIDPSDSFPMQTMLIDYVRVFQKGVGTQPPDTPVPATGATWTKRPTTDVKNWTSIASSADGKMMVAVAKGSKVYTSHDAGATWAEQQGSEARNWVSVASSADGTKLAALYDWGGYIVTSSDGGATWTKHAVEGAPNWTSIASSADGTKLVAVAKDKTIYTSSDSGVTWTMQPNSGSRKWQAVASSADGNKLVALVENGAVYTSTNAGVTWTERPAAGTRAWTSIASSADGTKLVATTAGGNLFVSTNSGTTWTERAADGRHNWTSATISNDGSRLTATAGGGGYIFSSSDGGASWVAQTSAGTPNWASVVSSADGTLVAAVAYGGAIYTVGHATPDEQQIAAAEAAVARAEQSKTRAAIDAAKALVDAVRDPAKKAALQARLAAIVATPAPKKPTNAAVVTQSHGGTVAVSTAGDQCYHIATAQAATAPSHYHGRTLHDVASFTITCDHQPPKVGYTTHVALTLSRRYDDTSRVTVAKVVNGAITEDITNRMNFGTTADGKYTTITYDVTDGGFGDEDGAVNGTITDPIAVYEAESSPIANQANKPHGQHTSLLADTGQSILLIVLGAATLGGAGVWLMRKKRLLRRK